MSLREHRSDPRFRLVEPAEADPQNGVALAQRISPADSHLLTISLPPFGNVQQSRTTRRGLILNRADSARRPRRPRSLHPSVGSGQRKGGALLLGQEAPAYTSFQATSALHEDPEGCDPSRPTCLLPSVSDQELRDDLQLLC